MKLSKAEQARISAKRSLQRDCKTMTLFRLHDDPLDGQWRTVMHEFDEGVKKYLVNKYGDRLAIIANESIENALNTQGAYITRTVTDYECNDLA